MFNPLLSPQFALAGAYTTGPARYKNGAANREENSLSSRMKNMLPGGVRGRGFGRGAPPISVPATNAPSAPTPASNPAGPSNAPVSSSETEAYEGQVPTSVPPSFALHGDFLEYVESMGQNIVYLRQQLDIMRSDLSAANARNSDATRVFDALHAELNDYKRDFIYEHMKPLLRPLLFLFDSLDSFDREMSLYEEAQTNQELSPEALKASKVRQNIAFCRDQLTEALLVCEVEPLPTPSGTFDPRNQKAIETMPVAPEDDGTIQKVIRIGWTMHGQLLRPAEVVIGKANNSANGGGQQL